MTCRPPGTGDGAGVVSIDDTGAVALASTCNDSAASTCEMFASIGLTVVSVDGVTCVF